MENPLRPDIPDGLELFETMRVAQGTAQSLDLHLDRLCNSCRALGVPFSRVALSDAVHAVVGTEPSRLRLSLQLDGTHAITQTSLPPAPKKWRLGVAETRVEGTDFWRAHKSTNRAIYDDAREKMPEGIDELLFLNTADFCAEGTITNLFVDPGDGLLRTPPLSAGVLPGILRRRLIEARDARVASLCLGDLATAKTVFMGNALRGLIPVSLDIPAPT